LTLIVIRSKLPAHNTTCQRPLVIALTPQHHLAEYLTQLLYDLESVEELLPHHPEENAMLHSLQTFEIADRKSDDQELIAAALLHDVGKSRAIPRHEVIGAELLEGLLPDYVVWLVAHHMDLVYDERKTNHVLRNTPSLKDLKRLRQWDLQARVVDVQVCSVEYAVDFVCKGLIL